MASDRDSQRGDRMSAFPPSLDPMAALHDAIAFSSRDFAEDRFEAWIYGIVVGWDDEDDETGDGGAMDEVAAKVGWTTQQVATLRKLRTRWRHIESQAPALLRKVTVWPAGG